MIAYRSVQKRSVVDYSATYRLTVNGQLLNKSSCACLFNRKYNWNYPVVIGNNVISCYEMFWDCDMFNAPVTIPNSVTNMSKMFVGCDVFNYPIQIPDGVVNCAGMFSGTPYRRDIYIPESVMDISAIVEPPLGGIDYNKSIYIKGNVYRNLKTTAMFGSAYGKVHSVRRSVYFNIALNNCFNNANYPTVVGDNVKWTSMTNGFYNSLYNVYCYYNYSG